MNNKNINKIILNGKEYVAEKNSDGEIVNYRLVKSNNKELENKAKAKAKNTQIIPDDFANGTVRCVYYKYNEGLLTEGEVYHVKNNIAYTKDNYVIPKSWLHNLRPDIVIFEVIENYNEGFNGRAICITNNFGVDIFKPGRIYFIKNGRMYDENREKVLYLYGRELVVNKEDFSIGRMFNNKDLYLYLL